MEVHYNPADYEDSTGEIAHILSAAALGGLFGGGGAALSSIVSQKMNGGKIDWKKVWGSAANGAFTGSTQAALLASGAGAVTALCANLIAGTLGSAAEQAISEGKVSARKSLTHGVTNAVSNALYGTGKLKNVKDAIRRGAKTGAAEAAINYVSDYIGSKITQTGMEPGTSAAILPYVMTRDPKKNCGGRSPFEQSTGYTSARGYWNSISTPEESRKKYSLGGFIKETLLGGLTGGLTSAAFYGAGKGIKKLKSSLLSRKSNIEPVNIAPDFKTDFIVTPNGTVMDTSKNYNLVGTGEKGDWFQIHNVGKPEDVGFPHTHTPRLNTDGVHISYSRMVDSTTAEDIDLADHLLRTGKMTLRKKGRR